MAEPLDVAARLSEGRPAVDNIGDYVWACHLLGYQNPDLTLHAAQVRDWYSSEDGLNLKALDADRAALDAAAEATDTARRLQEEQLGALADAWQGRGGEASHDFLFRHGESSAATASAVRDAAGQLTALRDDLWRAVDDKVATAVAIDDRRMAERREWLAATQTVTTGAGDRAVASELIDQQVKPFVDNDIRSDWLTAMQKAMATVAAAFDGVTAALNGVPAAMFEVPGDLGPLPSPSLSPPSPVSAPAAEPPATAPAGWPSAAPTAAPAVSPMAAPAPPFASPPESALVPPPTLSPPPTAPAATATPPMPTAPSLGDLGGGGLPGATGGLGGLGSQLADALGGLFDRPDGAMPDQPDLNEKLEEPEEEPDEEGELEAEEKPVDDEVSEDESVDDEVSGEPAVTEEPPSEQVDACAEESVDEPPVEEPAPTPPPPPPMPPPTPPIAEPPEPVTGETPCEIAADELPQAGP